MTTTISALLTLGILVWGGYSLTANSNIEMETQLNSETQAALETESDWYSNARIEIGL